MSAAIRTVAASSVTCSGTVMIRSESRGSGGRLDRRRQHRFDPPLAEPDHDRVLLSEDQREQRPGRDRVFVSRPAEEPGDLGVDFRQFGVGNLEPPNRDRETNPASSDAWIRDREPPIGERRRGSRLFVGLAAR